VRTIWLSCSTSQTAPCSTGYEVFIQGCCSAVMLRILSTISPPGGLRLRRRGARPHPSRCAWPRERTAREAVTLTLVWGSPGADAGLYPSPDGGDKPWLLDGDRVVLFTLDGLPFVARSVKGDAATAVSDAAHSCGFEPTDAISPPIVAEACFSPQRAAPHPHAGSTTPGSSAERAGPHRDVASHRVQQTAAYGTALKGGTDGWRCDGEG